MSKKVTCKNCNRLIFHHRYGEIKCKMCGSSQWVFRETKLSEEARKELRQKFNKELEEARKKGF